MDKIEGLKCESFCTKVKKAVENTPIAVILLFLGIMAGSASAATWTVDDSGGANYTNIQDAINNSSAGDTILVYSGTYIENVGVYKQLILRGIDNGGGNPVVNAGGIGSAITLFTDGIKLEEFIAINSGSSWENAGIKVSSNNNIITSNNASNNGESGIYLYHSSNNTLSENRANSNDGVGIEFDSSNNNTFSGNTANSNFVYGIALHYSNNNRLIGNNVSNTLRDSGIAISSSNNNTFSGNTINSNIYDGIRVEASSNNTLNDNYVSNNKYLGIVLFSSSNNNTVSGNNVSNNQDGIFLQLSSTNLIYNNIFSNINNAFDDGNNIWNIPKTAGTNIIGDSWLGGNFWSDYNGKDTGGDGLGDTMLPYNSSGGITNGGDYLPLVYVNTPDNIALGKPAYASSSWYNAPPSNAFDGDLNTQWNSGDYAPAWIYVDLKQNYNLSLIKLIVSQTPEGETTHNIYISQDASDWTLVRTLSGHTSDSQILKEDFNPPLLNVRYVKVETANSPSWIAWFEIEIYENPIGHGTLNITSFSPTTSIVTNNVGDSRTFSITSNQIVNVNWLINGTEVFNETGVITSSYINSSAALGTWNVSAVASNNNGTAIQTWDWIVTSVPTNRVHNINKGTNYTTIQAAIEDASPGDEIHVDSGTYYENVNLTKWLILKGIDIGGGKPIVNANGSGSAITLSAGNNTLEGFTATGSDWPNSGIFVNSNNNLIENNTVSNNYYGFFLAVYSDNNMLIGNNAMNNNNGIFLSSSSNNSLSGNIASNNNEGIYISYWSNHNTLSNNNASNNDNYGINLWTSSNNTLSENIASNNKDGIDLDSTSNNNMLSGNIASNNNERGIYLRFSDNNKLADNNASKNGVGILLSSSSNSMLIGNNASSNNYGFYLSDYSKNNLLIGNNVSKNNNGIYLEFPSRDNTIYNNVFNNINNLVIQESYGNRWNTTKTLSANIIDGIYLGGNFWANPSGIGFSQTCMDADSDGICDSPYMLDSNNIDYLPLAVPAVLPTGAPDITSFSPTISTVTNNVGDSRTFNITTNQIVNVSWLINGTEVFNETGVITSSYTNSIASLGSWNITAVASNANGTVMQKWDWIVTSVSTTNRVHNINKGTSYTTIQVAIEDANPGNEINVDSGTYYENVNMTKQLTLHGIGMPVVDARGIGSAITLSGDGITLDGFTAIGGGSYPESGIKVTSNSNTLIGNIASNNYYGISLYSSSNNMLRSNNASSNNYNGISLYSSSNNNTLSRNNALNNGFRGIELTGSNNNTLSGNTASLERFADGISLSFSNNNALSDNNVSNNNNGIALSGSSNNTLSRNNALNNGFRGIELTGSNNNTLSGNTASSERFADGISLSFSNNNALSDNNVSNNNNGISLYPSSNSNMLSGNIALNNFDGILLFSASNNMVSNNNVSNNLYHGINIFGDSSNMLRGNNVSSNGAFGIEISANNNLIYNNYFFNNMINARDEGENVWNINKTPGTNIINGPFLGGNFWSDYAGNDTDGDGLGDTMLPYNSSGEIANGGDYLPLIYVNMPGNVAPNITSFSPATSTVTNNVGDSRTFSITVNQTVNITWLINGTQVQENNSVTASSYTNTSAALGMWNVSALAQNANGSDVQTWIWNVTQRIIRKGSISGFKINDTNGNGKWDAGENGISNWTIRLIGITGKGNDTKIIRKETFTYTTGFYNFDNLPAGRYFVIEKLKKGFVPTSSPVKRIKLAQDENSRNNNFTNMPVNSQDRIDDQRNVDDYEVINRDIDKYKEDMDWD